MAASKFQSKLDLFLASKVINESDFETYIGVLNDLKGLLEQKNGFSVYADVVKNWISGFQTIFSEKKTRNHAQTSWETYMSKFCLDITRRFFTLLQCFRQFDPNYTQEFYIYWKTIVSRMNGLNRGDSFRKHINQFKIVIDHLRTATSRTEQFAVLAVLRFYIECVPTAGLYQLIDYDNAEVVKKIAKLIENPTIINQHAFLQEIDAMGHCIESVKPKRIICKKLQIDMDDTNFEMWLDFNKTEQSIVFATVCRADCGNQTFGIVSRAKLRQGVHDDHLLEINGIWNVVSSDGNQPTGQRVTAKIFFQDRTEQLIPILVKTIFRFVNSSRPTGSVLKGVLTDHNEPEPTLGDPDRKMSPQTAPRRTESPLSVIPPKLIPFGRIERIVSSPTPPKPFHTDVKQLNSSLPLFPRAVNENFEKDDVEELPIKSNLMNVKKQSVKSMASPMTNRTPTGLSRSHDLNATYVLRQSVNPIAAEQPENDRDSQKNYNERKIESPPIPWINDNESLASNRTYTIVHGALSDASIEAGHDNAVISKILYRDDMIFHLENQNPNGNTHYGDAHSRNKIEILENITIVPPTAQPELLEPMGHLPWKLDRKNVKFFSFSQVDERISVDRKVAYYEYSQPTTFRERFYVKDSSFQSRNIDTNQSVQRLSQRPIEKSPAAIHYDNRVGMVETLAPITLQNTFKHDDGCTVNLSTEVTEQSQQVSPWPIKRQYDSFIPITTSSQRSPVELRKSSHSQQASEDLIEMSTQAAHHSRDSSQKKAGSLQIHKFLSPTEVLPQAKRTSPSLQAIDNNVESNAGIESSSSKASQKRFSQHLSQKQATPKRAKCIAIADLPNMAQSQVKSNANSQRKQKSLQNRTNISQPHAESTTATISFASPKISTAKREQNKTAAPKIAKKSTLNKFQSTSATKRCFNPNTLKMMQTATNTLNVTKQASLVSPHNSQNIETSVFELALQALDEAEVNDQCNELEVAEGSLDVMTSKNDGIKTDDIRVDEQGAVHDDKGCVFADNDELQRAAKFYIENDGLNYLKRALPARKRENYERNLRTIRQMIDRGFDKLHKSDTKARDVDPYAMTMAENTVQGERKRKRRIKKVSVTLSKKIFVDNKKKVTFTRRTSKLYYDVDEDASTNSKIHSTEKNKSMSTSKKLFSKSKIAQTVKTPLLSSVNKTEANIKDHQKETNPPSNRADALPSSKYDFSEYDQTTTHGEDWAEVNISPISTSRKMEAGQHKHNNEISSSGPVEISFPIYASDEMIQKKIVKKPMRDPPPLRQCEEFSKNIDCSASASRKGATKTTTGECEMERELCSTTICDNSMKDLIAYLNEIEMESRHICQGSCEENGNILKTFIERLHRKHEDHGVSEWAQLLHSVLKSLESICKAVSDQLQAHQGQRNERPK